MPKREEGKETLCTAMLVALSKFGITHKSNAANQATRHVCKVESLICF
jgi:hypothetical protein